MLVVECWHDLGADRQMGFGVIGCIPFASIVTWAQFNELDRDSTMLIVAVIRRLDSDRANREASKRALEGGGP